MARAFKMKETAMSKKGIGYVVANGISIKNYGKERVVGHTESGDGLSTEIQRLEGKQFLGSVHKLKSEATWWCWTGREAACRTKRRVRRQV